MKSLPAFALATSLGLGLALPALAQDAAPSAAPRPGQHRLASDRGAMPDHGMGPGGMLMLACSDKGAEALEIALVRMDHRLDLSADQRKLFDTFRAKALSTATSFADTCKADRPTAEAGARPDALARMKAGIAIEQARLTALNDILPDFEALFDSLSDTQKANLLPHRGLGMGRPGQGDHGRMGRDAGRDGAPAPDAAPTNS